MAMFLGEPGLAGFIGAKDNGNILWKIQIVLE